MANKVTFTRRGVTKKFSEVNIQKFSSADKPWPESEGWVRVTEEVTDALKLQLDASATEAAEKAAAEKAEAEKAEAEKAQGNSNAPEAPKTSADFKTTKEDLQQIRELLAGQPAETVDAFFANESRSTILAIREEILNNAQ